MNHSYNNNPEEKELVNKVVKGDTYSFGTIIKNTERLVAQIVFRMINNREDRKDIAQDIYLKAYKNLPAFKFQSKLTTWIAQIAYNTCLNYLEKKKLILLSTNISKDQNNEERLELLADNSINTANTDSENAIFKKELKKILHSEIDLLSPMYKTLITLYHVEELSYDEIAEITRLPTGTVKNYLFRARKSLRSSILLKYKKEQL